MKTLAGDERDSDRAARSAAAAVARQDASAAAGGSAAGLGSKAIKEQQSVTASDLRKRLWALQRTMWAITDYSRLRGCHRWIAKGFTGASLRWHEPGRASWGGIQTSSSVWASPLSAASISKTRAEEVGTALQNWFQQDSGHAVEFLTLTLAHSRYQSLKEVWDALSYCWRGVTGTAAWRGGARTVGDKTRFGIEHWLKSVEVTHGKSGWHVHLHCLLFLKRGLSTVERESLEARLYSRWRSAAERKKFKAPSRKHGIKLERAVRDKNASDLGSYMAKGAVTSVFESLSWEMTSGQTAKTAKSENRSPFQILDDIRRSGDYSLKNPDVRLWRIWESGSLGRRQMAWSMGAKDLLGVVDLDDSAAEAVEEAPTPGVEVAQIVFEEWTKRREDTGEKLADDLHIRREITDYIAQARDAGEAYSRAERILSARLYASPASRACAI